MRRPACLCLLLALLTQAWAWGDGLLPINLGDGWIQRTQGPWGMRYDHRDLLAMRHPWAPSAKGAFASLSRKVTVPKEWAGDVRLAFYCSDDYNTDAWRPDGSWLTAEGFIGHRMKQVLVDDRVVWTADVSDPVIQGTPPLVEVPLGVEPGREFLLTLLVFDVAESTSTLADDFYQSANNQMPRDKDPDAARFMTNVYWGDLVLLNGEVKVPEARREVEKKVRGVHAKNWPLPPFGSPWDGPVTLEVSAPAGMPKEGFPVRFGVPVHAGKLTDEKGVSLTWSNGRSVYSQKTVLGTWPDESIQWVLFDFVATPDLKAVEFAFHNEWGKTPRAAKVKESEGALTVDTGQVQFKSLQGGLISDVTLYGASVISSMDLAINVNGEEIQSATESAEVLESGPMRATLAMEGKFALLDHSAGRYRLEVSAFAKVPYLRLLLRIYNDTAEDLKVSALKVQAHLPKAPAMLSVPAGEVQDGFLLRQVSEKSRELNGAAVDAVAPAYVAWPDGALTVRQFRELFPKTLSAAGDLLTADLVAAGETPVLFTPGEAKSHEIWIALGKVDAAQFAATVSAPPVLQNAAYYCSTGALGLAAPHEGVPVLHDHMAALGKTWEDLGQTFGVRDFPDAPYHGGLPAWCNNYYERMLGLWSEWAISGDRAWFDLASDVCRHIMDVAIVHSEVPGKDWLYTMHGPGVNHVAGPWSPTLRNAGLANYYKLTGDAEALDNCLGVSEFCIRSRAGLDSPSVRDHAGPFDAICTGYQETAEVDYLDAGAARVEAVLKRVDTRRGAWLEEHGSKVYRGNVPWMVAQLGRPLYLWYRLSGDVQAAQALVGLAESILCENTDWNQPGSVSGYSHNPHYAVTATYDLLIIPVIFAAYELTEDPFFLDAAKAQWERWKQAGQFDSPLNCYWNTPWLVYYLRRYEVEPALSSPSVSSEKQPPVPTP